MNQDRVINQQKKESATFSRGVAFMIAFLEMAVYLISFIPVVYCVKSFTSTPHIALKAFWLLSGYYGFQMYLMFVSAGAARIFAYPGPGRYELHDSRLNSLWIREAMSNLCYRTFVQSFCNFFPFPGYLYYRLLGAKIHPSVKLDYTTQIRNPSMVSIGANSNIGGQVTITAHLMPNIHTYVLGRVRIGNRVMIGGYSIISPDVTIGDDSIIAAHSFVATGTQIPSGEIWGGVPAKLIKKLDLPKPASLPHEIEEIVKNSQPSLRGEGSKKGRSNPISDLPAGKAGIASTTFGTLSRNDNINESEDKKNKK